jgi:hypothetical protein
MAVCCQNLTLGALSSRSALSLPVGGQFKKFGPSLNKPLFYTFEFFSKNNYDKSSLSVLMHYIVVSFVY